MAGEVVSRSNGATDLWAVPALSSAWCCAYRSAIRVEVHPQSRAKSTSAPPFRNQLSTNV